MRSTRLLSLGAVAGPMLFTVGWLTLGFLSTGYTLFGTHIATYSPISESISGLGLGNTGLFMNTTFVVTGLLMLVGVIGILQSLRGQSELAHCRTVFVLLALPALGSSSMVSSISRSSFSTSWGSPWR